MPKSRSKQKVVESSEAEFHSEEVDSKGKGKSMRLYCSHQNIIEPIDFEVVRGVNVNSRYHDIISEPPADYMIDRYNFERKYTLTPAEFDYTLKDWMENQEREVYDDKYEQWNVKRPSEWVRKLICAMIKVVFSLHGKQHFHGCLHHPENYGIRMVQTFEGGHHEENIEVILLYTNTDIGGLPEPTRAEMGIENDMMGLSHMIFDNILVGQNSRNYPVDLKDLFLLMADASSVAKNRWIIETHPYLWHWTVRCYYYEKVWNTYNNGDTVVQDKIAAAVGKVTDAKNWRNKMSRVPENSPIRRVYNKNKYSRHPMELVRFVRIVFHHITDIDPQTRKRVYLQPHDSDYLDLQYVEMKMTENFPMLMKDLYEQLQNVGIFV